MCMWLMLAGTDRRYRLVGSSWRRKVKIMKENLYLVWSEINLNDYTRHSWKQQVVEFYQINSYRRDLSGTFSIPLCGKTPQSATGKNTLMNYPEIALVSAAVSLPVLLSSPLSHTDDRHPDIWFVSAKWPAIISSAGRSWRKHRFPSMIYSQVK